MPVRFLFLTQSSDSSPTSLSSPAKRASRGAWRLTPNPTQVSDNARWADTSYRLAPGRPHLSTRSSWELDASEMRCGGGFESEMLICPTEGFTSVLAHIHTGTQDLKNQLQLPAGGAGSWDTEYRYG